MNSSERFRETMAYGRADRVPYFEEGIRDSVLDAWRHQGFSLEASAAGLFPVDGREEPALELEPRPYPRKWPTTRSQLKDFRRRLDPDDPVRWPGEWREQVRVAQELGYTIMLRVHRGFFETVGVDGWNRFTEIMYLLGDDPAFVHELLSVQADFAARLTERILHEIRIDAAIFSEPISGNDGPLISPRMYESFALTSYEPLLELFRRNGVETIILRTYANSRLLIPSILKWGFNCLWACEVNLDTMDYRDLRREFGRDLRLIGGIDLDALRYDQETIRREVEEKVPSLLADGGYVPLADGRVRADVPFDNYVYYRRLLERVIEQAA